MRCCAAHIMLVHSKDQKKCRTSNICCFDETPSPLPLLYLPFLPSFRVITSPKYRIPLPL